MKVLCDAVKLLEEQEKLEARGDDDEPKKELIVISSTDLCALSSSDTDCCTGKNKVEEDLTGKVINVQHMPPPGLDARALWCPNGTIIMPTNEWKSSETREDLWKQGILCEPDHSEVQQKE